MLSRLLALCSLWFFSAFALAQDFLDPDQAFIFQAHTQAQQVQVQVRIAPQYYLYRDQFAFYWVKAGSQPEVSPANVDLPAGEIKYDPTFDKELAVHHDALWLDIPLPTHTGDYTLAFSAQGCAEAGLCYPPMHYRWPVVVQDTGQALPQDWAILPSQEESAVPEATTQASSTTQTPAWHDWLNAGDTDLALLLSQVNLPLMLVGAFLLGLALSFTPCVLPMLPILLALVVGPNNASQPAPRRQALGLSLCYVLGTAIVYTLLGMVAALLGAALANWLQHPVVLSFFALALASFGIAMWGAFSFQVPSGLQSRLNALINRLPAGQYGGATLMGMLSALVCGPCVAAPLAGVLLFIAQTGDIFTGGVVLFVLAWGQGVSLLLLGASSGALLPKAGAWMESIKKLCGLLLLAAAFWTISHLLPNWVPMVVWAGFALAFATLLGTFAWAQYRPLAMGKLLRLALGWLAVAWAAALLIGVSLGGRSVLHPFTVHTQAQHVPFTAVHTLDELQQHIQNSTKPVLLDFYADWCIACKEMDLFTFSRPSVQAKMAQFTLLQVDVTRNSADHRALLRAFQLFGPPGIMLFGADGKVAVRIVGFQDEARFLQSLDKALSTFTTQP